MDSFSWASPGSVGPLGGGGDRRPPAAPPARPGAPPPGAPGVGHAPLAMPPAPQPGAPAGHPPIASPQLNTISDAALQREMMRRGLLPQAPGGGGYFVQPTASSSPPTMQVGTGLS